MHALLLSLIVALTPPAAPAPADHPPALLFAVDRAAGTDAAAGADARLREALAADPDNLWLHDAWQRLRARGALHDGRLEIEYRAFHAQSKASPARQLLLALAILRMRGSDRTDSSWVAEVTTLIQGVRGAPGLGPWTALAASQLARSQSDRALARKEIEDAWIAHQGHLALAPARAQIVGRDETVLVNFALEVAAREPRLVPRLLAGHTPPLDPGAVQPMGKLVKLLGAAVAKAPSDAALAWAWRSAALLLADAKQVAAAEQALRGADPGWQPESAPAATALEPDAPGFGDRLQAAISAPPGKASEVFAALEPDALLHPSLQAQFYLRWAAVHDRGPERDPARAVELYRKALAAPGIADSLDFARRSFALQAAASGKYLDEARGAAEQLVAAAWDDVRKSRGGAGAADDLRIWQGRLGNAFEVRGAVKARQGDTADARRDLVLATFNPNASGDPFARLAEVEEKLAHPADALDAWVGAVAHGAYEPERLAEWKSRLATAARGRLMWATVEEVVAAEVARLKQAGHADAEDGGAHPLVGKPAPDFEVARLGGGNLTLASLRGKPVVVDYWATWCGPCKMEMPALQRLHEKYAAQGVSFVLLSTDDDKAWSELVPGFVKGMELTMPVGRATEAVQSAYQVGGIPSLFLVGKDGRVVKHQLGYEAGAEDALEKEIQALLR